MIEKNKTKVDRFVELVIAIGFAIVIIVGSLQTFLRYTLRSPFFGAEELMRYLCIWVLLLAAGVGIQREVHIRVELLLDRLPFGLRRCTLVFINLMIIIFLVFVIVEGVKITIINMAQPSPAMRVPIGLAYLAIPIGAIFMLVNTIRLIVKDLTGQRNQI